MKHIFVINPSAGSGAGVAALKEKIAKLACKAEIYETTAHRDAVKFVKEYCEKHTEDVRFYACGGDGTLKEVAEGTVGYPHASFSVCPIGSGNDFVRYFGGADAFSDLEKLTAAENKKIDAIGISADGIDDTYSINVCNFGFEAYVAGTMHKVR
ncbi:MAG: diacylglycerol kinase family lipid kinase, partial [Clostridia bacterium]|nr:diacylglycerol kinase family lipid kinase [Clostridia bacterium]